MSIPSHTARAGDLHLEQLTKTYERTLAVDGIDLDVPAGRYVALLGPSGCGKTTTLRMIAGFEKPSGGRILLGADDLTRSRPHERPINTVFQSYALFPHLDVLGNVAFGPRRRRVKDAEARARQALDLVQLGALARRRPAELSGGEQQRVALARALVNDPAVLLLDEPLGALDLRLRRAMQDGLKELQNRLGTTFLHVTHDQEEALTLADEVAVMRGGRVEQYGSPQQVYELPQTAFVATFLGRALLAPARRVGSIGTGGGEAVEFAVGSAGIVRVPADRIAARAAADTDLLIGIRPERVRLRPGPPVDPADRSPQTPGPKQHTSPYGLDLVGPGTVISATFTGPGTAYQVAVDGLPDWQVLAANDGVTPRFAPGDIVHLAFDAGHAFAVSAVEPPS
ncbi:spermidine/putrescine transport system ATP-binding protein [Austwickia chelonae]|uniref:Putative ABC transporter ATP-binding protein n=1 Tax=Austwickia chelonae NBRC 105200 TaxID=1184607 RepID=K6UKN3_9MICO|nr:ABC transporter ATP-binding protein [Austwickia chelonae]GAB76536.1 putative ABC transporter ATP-binding protein [Austwickia chelonae NBRC 105200]SEW26386.1 spermidine/putrescine transport system ATP-binding protein [Austwickia chelonae]